MSGKEDGRNLLQDLVHYRTYAGIKENGKKESVTEVIDRVAQMHKTKFPWFEQEIDEAFAEVYSGRAVPSMRSMQFGGSPVFRSNARIYNCSYAPLTNHADFADLFWLLLNGVGAGFSVQNRHVSQLPKVTSMSGILRVERYFEIEDSKEGWADAIKTLLGDYRTKFIYSKVRPKGAPLSTGGAASGPEVLEQAIENIRKKLQYAKHRQLTDIECFDIMCYLADVVVVGSVRRAAMIALFDADSEQMLSSKSGNWFISDTQRMRANISAVIHREDEDFDHKVRHVLQKCFDSNSGEPGVFLTNDYDIGTNPCNEISLKPYGLCNLTEINGAACKTREEFLDAVESTTAIGTLQASYTDFSYLQPEWKKNADEEALLGVSITGQAQNWRLLTEDLLREGAQYAIKVNRKWAGLLGINPAARITCSKPSGNTSAWWGITSGIHAAHSEHILRRVRVDRKDAFGKFLVENYGESEPNMGSFIETDQFNAENIVLTIPVHYYDTIVRDSESAISLLERSKHIYTNWIRSGHVSGSNTHNVSLTVSYKPEEEQEIANWMVLNKDSWSGIALLPYDGGTYVQAPFEAISESTFHDWLLKVPTGIDFGEIDFSDSIDYRHLESACSGTSCEIV